MLFDNSLRPLCKVGKVCIQAKWLNPLELIPVSVASRDYRSISTSSWMGVLVHRRATPSIKFASTHLHTSVEQGTVRVKCNSPLLQSQKQ